MSAPAEYRSRHRRRARPTSPASRSAATFDEDGRRTPTRWPSSAPSPTANSGHGGGTHWVMTGYNFPPADNGGGQIKPGLGSILARHRGANNARPACRPTSALAASSATARPGSARRTPRSTSAGNARSNMNLPGRRSTAWTTARRCCKTFDTLDRDVDRSGLMQGARQLRDPGVRPGRRARRKEAFDVTTRRPADPRPVRQPGLGEQMLLARRLCEAGVGFVTLQLRRLGHARADRRRA